MPHVTDPCLSKDETHPVCGRDAAIHGHSVRSLFRGRCRCRGGGICPRAARPRGCPRALDSGPDDAARMRAPVPAGSWRPAPSPAARPFAAGRCDDRRGRGAALPGAFRGGGRSLGRSAGAELHRDEASGPAGRGCRCTVLADPAWRRGGGPQRGAGPLADCLAALLRQSRRCRRSRRSPLAAGTLPVARQAAGGLAGAP